MKTDITATTNSNPLTNFVDSGRNFVSGWYNSYDNYVGTKTHAHFNKRIASVAHRILQGLPVALFLALFSHTTVITATATVIFLVKVDPDIRKSHAISIILNGLCLYTGCHASAYLINAVATERLVSNLLTGLAYGAVSAYSYYLASGCKESPRAMKMSI